MIYLHICIYIYVSIYIYSYVSRTAEHDAGELRTDKIRFEADLKATTERSGLLERQLESAETRFRDALAYQQRASEVAGSPRPATSAGEGGAGASGGSASRGGGMGSEEVALMSSRLLTLESEKSLLQKQQQEVQMHRDNWHSMATQNEKAVRELRADLETRRANADKERQSLEALLAEKTEQLTASDLASSQRQEKLGQVERERNTLKDQMDGREGALKNSMRQVELERDGLKERLKMAEEEAARLELLRSQALSDYEREVSHHAANLEEMRQLRANLAQTQEQARQAVAAAEERASASVLQVASEGEAKRLLDLKVKDLQHKVRDLEERNSVSPPPTYTHVCIHTHT